MKFPQGFVRLDIRSLQLIDSAEIAATSFREKGNEVDAIALFRLRTRIRQGLSFEEAKPIFDKHIKTHLGEKT